MGWHSPDNSVGTFTNNILDIVLLADIEGDLAGVGRSIRGLSPGHDEQLLVFRGQQARVAP